MRPKWLRLTEEINALDFLEKGYYFIKQTELDKIAWKWVIISLHGALYGFAVCACKGTSSDNVIKNNRLINFDEALKKCQDKNIMHMTCNSKYLKLSDQQKWSIKKLKKEFRNNFEHYIPTSWSIEIHGMPRIILDVLDVIKFLSLETGNYTHLNQTQIKK
jgi:hypothetical protein